jgi:ubiquinone/menaquinone biosynthesis C-methylase UbiE
MTQQFSNIEPTSTPTTCRLEDPALPDPSTIELLNAHGPYSHGNWEGRGFHVGNEEALTGRGAYLVKFIQTAILNRFNVDELRSMTLLDVGCYDGWITCRLAEALPFARVIGVEPRKKNLEKGQQVRRLLGIETRCEFVQGSIETLNIALGGAKADVVVCVGLLQHLASTAQGIKLLHQVCSKFLFIEAIGLSSKFENQRVRNALKLKDLPYFYGKTVFGVTGHKLESAYYDGSATQLSVVSFPSPAAVRMFLEVQGFTNIQIVAGSDRYSRSIFGGWSNFNAACFTAEVNPWHDPASAVAEWIEDYEGGLIRTLLQQEVIEFLQHHLANGHRRASPPRSWIGHVALHAMRAKGPLAQLWLRLLQWAVPDRHALEILKNIRFAPVDKIALERGKLLMGRGEWEEADKVLKAVTCRLNADWRSVYRAFCLLAWSCRQRGDAAQAGRYEELCRLANPQFPAAVLADSAASFRTPIA